MAYCLWSATAYLCNSIPLQQHTIGKIHTLNIFLQILYQFVLFSWRYVSWLLYDLVFHSFKLKTCFAMTKNYITSQLREGTGTNEFAVNLANYRGKVTVRIWLFSFTEKIILIRRGWIMKEPKRVDNKGICFNVASPYILSCLPWI